MFIGPMIDDSAIGGNDRSQHIVSQDEFFATVRSGDADAVATLLEQDPALITTREDGGTALHYAAWEGHIVIVDLLLARGADLDARDERHGMLPIAWANEHLFRRDFKSLNALASPHSRPDQLRI